MAAFLAGTDVLAEAFWVFLRTFYSFVTLFAGFARVIFDYGLLTFFADCASLSPEALVFDNVRFLLVEVFLVLKRIKRGEIKFCRD